jgi:IMP dehydrogenase
MLAGCDETPGEVEYKTMVYSDKHVTTGYKTFRGMASKEAQDEFMGGMPSWKAAEGVEIKVAVKGPVADVMSAMMGGTHSGMTYCGANTIAQIKERADWVEVSAAGATEGRPHGQGRL